MNVLDRWYIGCTNWLRSQKEAFVSDERGVSGIVAAVILVLVAVVLAAAFWENINKLVTDWWDRIFNTSSGIGATSDK